jgi:hypothetical protein
MFLTTSTISSAISLNSPSVKDLSTMNNFLETTINPGNFVIKDLMYIPAGNYNPVMLRPYVAHYHREAIDNIKDRLTEANTTNITPKTISGLVSNIVQPSPNLLCSAVDSNWVSTGRFVFLLIVSNVDSTGTDNTYYIYGHTEYDGITNSGAIDTNMRHYVNNVIETYNHVVSTPQGVYRLEKLSRIYHVTYNGVVENIFLQRPVDILEKYSLDNITRTMQDYSDDVVNYKTMHADTMINRYSNKSAPSLVENNIPTYYVAKILDAGLKTNMANEIFVNSYHVTDNEYSNYAAEPSMSDNMFLRVLGRMEGYAGLVNSFSMTSLMKFDPTIYSRFKVYNINKDIIDPYTAKTPDVGDYWTGRDPVTIKAYELIESSVSMALKYGLSKVYFTASNMSNALGTPEMFIMNFNSFINLDEMSFNTLLDLFKSSFMSDIFNNEVMYSGVPLHMDVYVDILGTSKIYLQYSGFPGNWYTIPTFANSLFAPVVTSDEATLENTTVGLGTIIQDISTSIRPGKYSQQF